MFEWLDSATTQERREICYHLGKLQPFIVALASAIAIVIRYFFDPLMASDHAFVIPLLGVVFVAWHSGFWPGILNLVCSGIGIVYLFIEPKHTFIIGALSDQLALGFYVFSGFACVLLGHSQLINSRRAARHLAISQSKQQELEILTEQLKVAQKETLHTMDALFRSEQKILRSHEELEKNVQIRTHELLEEVEERRLAEVKLVDATEELRRSNGELEQFAYVASHDLQEPLRKIQAFGDRLKIKCADKLDETSSDYLQRMLTSAGRMRQLINDLLDLSRVTSQAQAFVSVDLNTILAGVLSDYELRIAQTASVVDIEPLGSIVADPLQMRQLFYNLLGNALKFHKPGSTPRVAIRKEDLPGEIPRIRLLVTDNGIGFDDKYLDKIFQVFQRLHSREEFEGTGVGLAICHKIVLRHGGEITARSRPGHGTTFIVTLPKFQSAVERV